MRIAFAGCWHADTTAALKAIDYLHDRQVSTIVHTGDFLWTHPVTQRFLHVVNRELTKRDMSILVVRGNHDNPAIFKSAPTDPGNPQFRVLAARILHAPDGATWEWESVKFAALGGARSVDWSARKPGKEWWLDEATEEEAILRLAQSTFDVLVTHDVPGNIPLDFLDRATTPSWWDIEGAEAHRQRFNPVIEQARPSIVISGHMHTRHDQTLEHDGHTYTSIILDRGDYPITRQTAERIHSNNLYIADVQDGTITETKFE